MNYLIGVDIGTQGTKTTMRDETGNIAGEAFIPSRLLYPNEGAIIQDPEEMLASVVDTINSVISHSKVDPRDVKALGICGQMAGIIGVDRSGSAVTPYDSWLDTRCGKYRELFISAGETDVIKLTGCPVTFAHGPKILWWKHEHPDVYKKIHSFVQPSSYCIMRLCGLDGRDAFIDHTYLHFSGFGDNNRQCWSEELLGALDVAKEKMPRIMKSFDIAGYLTKEMSASCGLAEGTPVVAGCGDTAASSFGAGVIRSGLLFDVAGTASVLACATNHYSPDVHHKTIMYAPSVIEGLYTPMAYISGGGMCLKWMRDDVLGKNMSYEDLDALAYEVPPGSGGLLFIPHFSGRTCPNDEFVRGSYINLTWKHNVAHMYRAIMEGIAYEYGIYADIIKELVPSIKMQSVISVGGGSRSKLFAQIKSDVLGIPVYTYGTSDTASLGCCAIAGYGIGLYNSVSELIEKTTNLHMTAEPDMKRNEYYMHPKNMYTKAINSLRGVYEEAIAINSCRPWKHYP